jgi:DNA topoisomerase-1
MTSSFIKRVKNGNSFKYTDINGNSIKDPKIIKHITSIRVPPAYKNVQIYTNPKSKVFAKGIDEAGRSQYIYNPKYVEKQSKNKYCNLIKFGKKLPAIRAEVDKMIRSDKMLTKNKMIGLILRIIMQCNFRVGNEIYKKKHSSYGISTIENKHIKFKGSNKAEISFIGKKGVLNECLVSNSTLVSQLRELIDKCGKDGTIFRYKDPGNGSEKKIKANDINEFLSKFGPFTSKSFRTFEANMIMLERLFKDEIPDVLTHRKKKVVALVKEVAEELHHTPAICRKSYLIPDILETYVENPAKFEELKRRYKRGNKVNNILLDYLGSICS